MMTASKNEAFRRSIAEKPYDDLPRLAYADWLDERGEPEAAARIRVEKLTPSILYPGRQTAEAAGWHRHAAGLLSGVVPKSWRVVAVVHPDDDRTHPPKQNWGEMVAGIDSVSESGRSVRNPLLVHLRHGFVSAVGGRIEQLTRVLPDLFRSQPVTEVGVIGLHVESERFMVPTVRDRQMTGDWFPVLLLRYNRIPRPVWDRLTPPAWTTAPLSGGVPDSARSYSDRGAACEDLSRAFVAYGRELAGLSRLS